MPHTRLEWLYPGIGIKRWLFIGFAGGVLLVYALLVGIGCVFSRALLVGLGMAGCTTSCGRRR